ncbi:hypothetical protein WA026_010166 [Henosepilachna vigintioctopunctata]|uniref:Uncharacterized protein n=1 Tax=Henosepilachna vigintioctopunctata TaxID=420089 RepID=A0AAW1UIG0_9CUCU
MAIRSACDRRVPLAASSGTLVRRSPPSSSCQNARSARGVRTSRRLDCCAVATHRIHSRFEPVAVGLACLSKSFFFKQIPTINGPYGSSTRGGQVESFRLAQFYEPPHSSEASGQ